MTKEQIELLRSLIQGEIEYFEQAKENFWGSFDQEKMNDQAWEAFKESFTRLRMTTTGGDTIGDV
jgi:hypothetical protein